MWQKPVPNFQVREGRDFNDRMGNKKYFISYCFDCDSTGIIYLIEHQKCSKY